MSIIANNLLQGDEGYNISRSLRFRSSASAYLSRTPASASNRRTWTWSAWVKRGALGSVTRLFSADNGGQQTLLRFQSDNTLQFQIYNSGVAGQIITTQVFRDCSAWYHIVAVMDTVDATSSNRMKLYVNGTQVSSFSTASYPSQNYDAFVNQNILHSTSSGGSSEYWDGYLTEVNFIDGQALTPSSFGETDPITGVWKPKKYGGTYGTNGFYLPFSDNTSTTTLGYDKSGNSNNWTTNNISLTAGSTYDSMTDVPTLTSATTANYCVLNPLDKGSTSSFTFSDGNLKSANSDASNNYMGRATVAVSSGKWYWEVTLSSGSSAWAGGIATTTTGLSYSSLSSGSSYAYSNNGNSYNGQTGASYGATYTAGDVIGVALDLNAGTLVFYKNGTSQGTAFTGISGTYAPAYLTNSSTVIANFGQQPFTYTPPTGFVALNTYNLPTSTIVKGNTVMDATLWTGNGSTQTITNAAPFKPDFVWIKQRSGTGYHVLEDTVRGATKNLSSNSTDPEATIASGLTSFNSNGFSLGSNGDVNASAGTYVGWQWQAGQGTNTSNTSGSITSTVSANPTAGFSVVTYTGTGANATVGHGLGVAPSMIIVKSRVNAYNWVCYNSNIGNTNKLYLDLTDGSVTDSTAWNNTSPTSSTFSLGSNVGVNQSGGTYVAYCWSEIAGFSKFTSYVGNASTDGPFVYCGFRPKFIMTKATSTGSIWGMWDSSRNTYNAAGNVLQAQSSDAEISPYNIDILSNGFKMRDTNSNWNGSGQTFIVMAFAENPFKNALAR